MKIYYAIDPGYEGYICKIEIDSSVKVEFFPMPIIETSKKSYKKGKKAIRIKKDIDGVALAKLFKDVENPIIYMEQVSARPEQGVCSMFNFGEGYGVVKGVFQALGLNFTLISPQHWKNRLIPQELRHLDKGSSSVVGKQIAEKEGWDINFPMTPRSKVIYDGAADAFCMAYCAFLDNK
jgi:crossover junction endodeoxyribonuclease RuvC